MDDIRESDGATYYLQPVVIKGRPDGSFELVDGQQRLTTLYLIFSYLRSTHLPAVDAGYSLTYETRTGSKDYLERLTEEDSDSNIDFFHIFHAYQCISNWFQAFGHRESREATRLHDALFDRVKVLWYEAPNDVDSTDLFTRLNVGRIPLTDAELVKALLLSHSRDAEGHTDRALEIATHWDSIERDLREPELWAFLTGESTGEATHISRLLETLAQVADGRHFQTFESLRSRIESDPRDFWREVVELHSLVRGWYEDESLFHKIGYLTAVGRSFGDLVDLSRKRGRSAFEGAIDDEIRTHVGLTADGVANLTHASSKTSDVLLLMNVETIRRRAEKGSLERYSFQSHAALSWSHEHIHAQQAKPLTRTAQWEAWLEDHKKALVDLPGVEEDLRSRLLGKMGELTASEMTQAWFNSIEVEVARVFTPSDEARDVEMDSIANLALLDQPDNSALSNSVFEVKRRYIIQRDKAGSYIPVCTRNVFLKYYTDSDDQQLHFWSAVDRQNYLREMLDVLSRYLEDDHE